MFTSASKSVLKGAMNEWTNEGVHVSCWKILYFSVCC